MVLLLFTGFSTLRADESAPEDTPPAAPAAPPAPPAFTPPPAKPYTPPTPQEAAELRVLTAELLKNKNTPKAKLLDVFEEKIAGKLPEKQQPIAAEAVLIGRVLLTPEKPPAVGELPSDCYVTRVCKSCNNACEVKCRRCNGKGQERVGDKKGGWKLTPCTNCNKTGFLPCPKKCVKEAILPEYRRDKTLSAYEQRLTAVYKLLATLR